MTSFLKNLPVQVLLVLLSYNFSTPVVAQDVNSSQSLKLDSVGRSDFNRNDFRGRISDDYLRKFSEMSDLLELREAELVSLRYRLEAVIKRSKSVNAKAQKELFREIIATLKINEDKLSAEIKLIKKALYLLKDNKSKPDASKINVLNEIADIEIEIRNLDENSQKAKNDVILGGVKVDELNPYLNPPNYKCNLIFDGIDKSSRKVRKEVERAFFFGYTHPKLKSFFKDKHFLTCETKIIKLARKNYLWLYITIASKDAKRTYGNIDLKSTFKFELLDGEILYLQNAQNSSGSLEAYTGNTSYEIVLPLDKSQTKQLTKAEVDKIGIMWSSGYEEYEIYNIDLLKNQLNCVNQK